MPRECVGRVALVTGASQGGTGSCLAIRLAAEGARVAITARSLEGLERTRKRIEAVGEAVLRGLSIPIVYNTSAYDSIESLKLLDGVVDIYMPDFKFWKNESSSGLEAALR